jgi:hypothetical protein
MTRRTRLAATLAAVAFTVTGCSSEPVTGIVTDKVYDDPDVTLIPMTTCNGKTCVTTQTPVTRPGRWLLVVLDTAGHEHDVPVPRDVYDDAAVGDRYIDPEKD